LSFLKSFLSQREGQLDRDDDRNFLSLIPARDKSPLPHGLDRFLIQTEHRIERADDLNAPTLSGRFDDAFDLNTALNLRAHRVGRVLRLGISKQARTLDTASRTVRATARSAAKTFSKP
jgi:hypothetical protein